MNVPALASLLEMFDPERDPGRDRQLKFVVGAGSLESDLAEIESLLARLPPVRPSDVLLMPEGVRTPSAEVTAAVVGACTARGWRYCTRLHIALFGNTRGT